MNAPETLSIRGIRFIYDFTMYVSF